MSRALVAAFKSQLAVQIDRHHLAAAELVPVGLSIAATQARHLGLDRAALHLALDQAIMQDAPDLAGAEQSAETTVAAHEATK